MAQRSEVSVPDCREAVLCLLRREQRMAAIARPVSVSEPTLYRWRHDFLTKGEAALNRKNSKSNLRDRRIAELEQQIEKGIR